MCMSCMEIHTEIQIQTVVLSSDFSFFLNDKSAFDSSSELPLRVSGSVLCFNKSSSVGAL